MKERKHRKHMNISQQHVTKKKNRKNEGKNNNQETLLWYIQCEKFIFSCICKILDLVREENDERQTFGLQLNVENNFDCLKLCWMFKAFYIRNMLFYPPCTIATIVCRFVFKLVLQNCEFYGYTKASFTIQESILITVLIYF